MPFFDKYDKIFKLLRTEDGFDLGVRLFMEISTPVSTLHQNELKHLYYNLKLSPIVDYDESPFKDYKEYVTAIREAFRKIE